MAERPYLILDTMGADLGIREMVRGAALACAASKGLPFDLAIVSADPRETEQFIKEDLEHQATAAGCGIELIAAAQKLPAEFGSPVEVYRDYPQCSIRVAMELARNKSSCAVVSPGTTGLVMAAATFTLGRLKGIERPPIGTPMPTRGKDLFFVDGGSSVDCRASQLYEFAVLAHFYIKNMQKIERPSIALLSNGSEAYKGTAVVREAAALLEADKDLNFIGYTEGHTVLQGNLDVMVCDGFMGNIFLKLAEGVAELVIETMRTEIRRDFLAALAAKLIQRRAFKRITTRLDYTRFGGAPLLGLNGNVVICHGRSPARAIENALLSGCKLAVSGMAGQVAQYVESHPQLARVANGAKA